MEKLIADIEREAIRKTFNEKAGREDTLSEFAERVCPFPISPSQKKLLDEHENAQKEESDQTGVDSNMRGKKMILRIVDEWEKANGLREHRCTCGRLLGKFSGMAEVKCPKCGKVNEIGVRSSGNGKIDY